MVLKVRRKSVAGKAGGEMVEAASGVGAEVGDEAHGGQETGGSLFEGSTAAVGLIGSEIEVRSHVGDPFEKGVADGDLVINSVAPFADVGALGALAFLDAFAEGAEEDGIPIGEPTGRLAVEEGFDVGGADSEFVVGPRLAGGLFDDHATEILIGIGNDERGGKFGHHLTVPLLQQFNCGSEVGIGRLAALPRLDDVGGEVVGKAGVDVGLEAHGIGGGPLLDFGTVILNFLAIKAIGDLAGAVGRSEVSGDGVLVVSRERILVGGEDAAGGGIIEAGEFSEGDEAFPIELAGGAFDGDIAGTVAADGELARDLKADVALGVGVDEVAGGGGEVFEGGAEFGPVGGAVKGEDGELEGSGDGGGPLQGGLAVADGGDGAVDGDPLSEFNARGVFDGDEFAVEFGLEDLAFVEIAAGVGVELFEEVVLRIEAEVGDAPGDAGVAADDDAGDAGDGETEDVEAVAAEVNGVPSAGEAVFEMGVVGEEGFAGGGSSAGEGPGVGAGLDILAADGGEEEVDFFGVAFFEEERFLEFDAAGGGEAAEHEEADGERIFDAPGSGVEAEEAEFDGVVAALGADVMVDAAGVSGEGGAVGGGEGGELAFGDAGHAEGTGFAINRKGVGADDFREGAGGGATEGFHLPESILGGGEALGEEEVVEGLCFDQGKTVGVSLDGGGSGEGGGEGAGGLGEGTPSVPPGGGDSGEDDESDEGVDKLDQSVKAH